jgi:hypothetical protein
MRIQISGGVESVNVGLIVGATLLLLVASLLATSSSY